MLSLKLKVLMAAISKLRLIAVEEEYFECPSIAVYTKKWRNLVQFVDHEDHIECLALDSGFDNMIISWSDPQLFDRSINWLHEYVKFREDTMYGKW